MDILEEYISENGVTKENILKLVDEYSIYCFYIGLELEIGAKYSSPLREENDDDDNPSFALYNSKTGDKKLLFKDHGRGISGDVFRFVSVLSGLDFTQVLHQINGDLELGLAGKEVGEFKRVYIKRVPIVREPVKIKITSQKESRDYNRYWKTLDISQITLDIFYAKEVAIIHYITKSHHKTIATRTLCISYEIYGYYKIYQPFNKRFKFSNDYPSGYVEGAIQLRWNLPFVIITKATKECMFFREHFDWDACAGTSENSMISDAFMQKLFAKYPVVFIWLDNDAPGQVAQKRYTEKYPQLKPIYMDVGLAAKDVTDLYLLYKKQNRQTEVLEYSRKLINTNLSNEE